MQAPVTQLHGETYFAWREREIERLLGPTPKLPPMGVAPYYGPTPAQAFADAVLARAGMR